MAFVKPSSTRRVNRIPMLLISRFCGEPTITGRAIGAPHHLNETRPHFRPLIAAPPIGHHPLIRGCLNVRLVHLSHLLHRKSVDVDVDFIIIWIHLHLPHRSIEVLNLRGLAAFPPGFHTSPQNTLTNFGRLFLLMFSSGLKFSLTHLSTSSVVAEIGVGMDIQMAGHFGAGPELAAACLSTAGGTSAGATNAGVAMPTP